MSEKLFHDLRLYKIDSLVKGISQEIGRMFDKNEPHRSASPTRLNTIMPEIGRVGLSAWSLSDIASLAIQKGDDSQTRLASFSDIVLLANEYMNWEGNLSKSAYHDLSSEDLELKFAIGFSQKQFWYQDLSWFIDNFNRQVEILEIIAPTVESKLDLDLIFRNATGFDIKTFRILLFALFACAIDNPEVTQINCDDISIGIVSGLSTVNLRKIAEFYTASYEQFRNESEVENRFYKTPVVRTSDDRLVVVDLYQLLRKVVDGPLWIMRDCFLKQNSEEFIKQYGVYFDHYVERVLRTLLPQGTFRRVPASTTDKCADWLIETQKYRIVVELKSAFATWQMRKLYPDLRAIERYIKKFEKGVVQLDCTARAYPTVKPTIKLLVHCEELYISDGVVRPRAVSAVADKLIDSGPTYFCSISEFEWLVKILGVSEDIIDGIFQSKLERENNRAAGREFHDVIPSVTAIANDFARIHLNHWYNYMPIPAIAA